MPKWRENIGLYNEVNAKLVGERRNHGGKRDSNKIYAQQRHLRTVTPISRKKALQSPNMTLPERAVLQFIYATKTDSNSGVKLRN